MSWLKQAETLSLQGYLLKDAKLQPINGFSLFLVLDLDIPHGCIKTFVTGEVFYGEGCHPLLMQPGAEGMSQDMGTSLTLGDASQFQVSSHYTINIVTSQIAAIGSHKEPAILSLWALDQIPCQYARCLTV